MLLVHFLARKAYMITVNARYRFEFLKALSHFIRPESKHSEIQWVVKKKNTIFNAHETLNCIL